MTYTPAKPITGPRANRADAPGISLTHHIERATWYLIIALICSGLAGCSAISPQRTAPHDESTEEANCIALFRTSNEQIDRAGVWDAQYARIDGFPFLRVNRFLASYRGELSDPSQRSRWIRHLAELDRNARSLEMANTNQNEAQTDSNLLSLNRCRALLTQATLRQPESLQALQQRAVVTDNYDMSHRIAGIYPITSRFVLAGVSQLHDREGRYFEQSNNVSQLSGTQIYAAAAPTAEIDIERLFLELKRDVLGIPVWDPAVLDQLFARFSPRWSITPASNDDKIGTLEVAPDRVIVNTSLPGEYRAVSYARHGNAVLVQLNYTVWFPARTRTSPLDLLGGSIDGITWRVTLDGRGQVLMMDAMHNCGCYYMAFPTPALKKRELSTFTQEPLWVPAYLPAGGFERANVELSVPEHYIRRISFADVEENISLDVKPYDALRSVAHPDGRRSNVFNEEGLIAQSRRAERWFLWPMGIRSAGAMRQSGNHPIAFVGRRHFDDPDLIEQHFQRVYETQ